MAFCAQKNGGTYGPAEALGDGGCFQRKTLTICRDMVNRILNNLKRFARSGYFFARSPSARKVEAPTGIEPVYTDLQSAASPLRHRAAEWDPANISAPRHKQSLLCGKATGDLPPPSTMLWRKRTTP